MDEDTARQIAELINARNQLTVNYTAKKILDAADNYLYRLEGSSRVVGVVEVKPVQWYQSEIDHLSVHPEAEGRGIGFSLVEEAELKAIQQGARIAQCTIRADNERSQAVFQRRGFAPAVSFCNRDSGNHVTVYQKALVTA